MAGCCLGLLGYYLYRAASTGVGGDSFAGILVQCVYKSYASVDRHQKTGAVFTSVTDVLTRHGQRAGQSALSADFGTDKMDRHNCTDYYDILLESYVKQTVNVMEIGVKKGGSIKMWRELFSQESRIFGVDIDPAIPSFPMDANIKTMVLDSSRTLDLVRAVAGVKFDIIIDDGDHRQPWQVATFLALAKSLKPTGLYLVEDVYHCDILTRTLSTQFPAWRWAVLADKTLDTDTVGERLVAIYGPESLAPGVTRGVLEASPGAWHPS